MRTLKSIFAQYNEYLRGLLLPLGPWGIFLIAFVDASFLGIPIDPLVAYFIYQNPKLFWLYTLAASAGSALGSLVPYYIGRKGEELLLEKRIPKARLEKMKRSFERHEALALVLPAMLPPPTPFKLFVFFAGAAHIPVRDFLLAIFGGRVARFLILTGLVLWFGPGVVDIVAVLFRRYLWQTLLAFAVVAVIVYLYLRRRGKR